MKKQKPKYKEVRECFISLFSEKFFENFVEKFLGNYSFDLTSEVVQMTWLKSAHYRQVTLTLLRKSTFNYDTWAPKMEIKLKGMLKPYQEYPNQSMRGLMAQRGKGTNLKRNVLNVVIEESEVKQKAIAITFERML